MIISLPFAREIRLLQKRGNKNRTRLVDLTKIAHSLMDNEYDALVGLHAFTGCDSVSSVSGKGKVPALRLMRKNTSFIDLFSKLGRSLTVSDELFTEIEKFVCELYGGKKIDSVSDLRYGMFCAKGAEITSHQLPPSQASLKMHTIRANYQAHI